MDQENFSLGTLRNFYFRLGTNYKLTAKSNLLFNYNLNLGNDRFTSTSTAFGDDHTNFRNNSLSKNKNNSNEISLQHKTKLDSLGRTLDVTAYLNLFDRNPHTTSSAIDYSLNQNSFNNGDLHFNLKNYYVKYDAAFPFKEMNFTINTGGKYNVLKVSDFGKYNINSLEFTNDYNNQTDFDYSENNLAFYVEARKKIKKFNFAAGLRFENFQVDREANHYNADGPERIKYSNTNLFPNLSVLYEINDGINVSGDYSRKIAQPGYYVLDPNNSSAFDKYNSSQGNLKLRPAFFDNYGVTYRPFQFFSIGASYSISKDNNRFVFGADDDQFISNRTFQQFDRINIFSAFLSFPIHIDYFFKSGREFHKRKNSMDKMNYIFVNINYVKSEIEGPNLPIPNKAVTNYSLQSQFILPWEITNTMSYFIFSKGNWEVYQIGKPIQQFDISLNRDFMSKRLKFGLYCFDVFDANEVNVHIAAKNLNTNFYRKNDSRTFGLSLTWNFGNLKLHIDNTNIKTDKTSQDGGLLKID